MSSNLPKPWKYKDWLIWPNTSLDRMESHRIGCADTINGVCLKNLSIKECMDMSDSIGYYIKFKNGNSICVPLNKEYNINYTYKLVNQDIHPELKDVSISTFLNTNDYKFPPNEANTVFYFDLLQIENSKTNLIFNSVNTENDDNYIEFSNNKFTNITFVPILPSPPDVSSDISISYTKHFFITLPGTRLFLIYDEKNNIFRWKTIDNDILNFGRKYSFQIYPITLNNIYYKNRLNTDITYQENFIIYYNNTYLLTLDDKNILRAEKINITDLIKRNIHDNRNTFRLKSKMIGYYCDENKCKPVSIDNTIIFKDILKKYNLYTNKDIQKIIDNPNSKKELEKLNINKELISELKYFDTDSQLKNQVIYKNKIVNINKDCWGICSYSSGEPNTIIQYSDIEPPFKFINEKENTTKINTKKENENNKGNKIIPILILLTIIIGIIILILKYF
jgi:hypothetical protein